MGMLHPRSAGPVRALWFFGDREYLGKQRDLENRIAVGCMRRPVECLVRVPGLRAAGLRLRLALQRFVVVHPELLGLSFPGRGGALWATLRHASGSPVSSCGRECPPYPA